MGRSSSKLNKKFEELVTGHTLPRCPASKLRKVKEAFRKSNTETQVCDNINIAEVETTGLNICHEEPRLTSTPLTSPAKTASPTKSVTFATLPTTNNLTSPTSSTVMEVNPLDNYVTIKRRPAKAIAVVTSEDDEDSGYFNDDLERIERVCESDSEAAEEAVYESLPVKRTATSDIQHHAHHLQPLHLRPLYFEVPTTPTEAAIATRYNVLEAVLDHLEDGQRGVVLTGGPGAGKTTIILDLVQQSCFSGRIMNVPGPYNATPSLARLADRVVGYHFLQPEEPATLSVPGFVHSLAAQLTQHPGLTAYHHHLLHAPHLLSLLQPDQLAKNPGRGLELAVLNPLRELHRLGQIDLDLAVVVIDSLNEGLSANESIRQFLAQHLLRLPAWLKIVATVDLTALDENNINYCLPLPHLDLSEFAEADLQDYIENRIFNSPSILNSISVPRARRNALLVKLVNFLTKNSAIHHTFTYPKMVLDLLESGCLVVKSESLGVVPRNLSEAFHLYFSQRFPSGESYRPVATILAVCLAARRPPSLAEVLAVCHSNNLYPGWNLDQLRAEYEKVSGLLVTRADTSLMVFHSSLAGWLQGGIMPAQLSQASKQHQFYVNQTDGHNLWMKHLGQTELTAKRDREAVTDFIHHLVNCSAIGGEEEEEDKRLSAMELKSLYLNYKVSQEDLEVVARTEDSADPQVTSLLALAVPHLYTE